MRFIHSTRQIFVTTTDVICKAAIHLTIQAREMNRSKYINIVYIYT